MTYIKLNSYSYLIISINFIGLIILGLYYVTWYNTLAMVGFMWAGISVFLLLALSFYYYFTKRNTCINILINSSISISLLCICLYIGSILHSAIKISFTYGSEISDNFKFIYADRTINLNGSNGNFNDMIYYKREGDLKLVYYKNGEITNYLVCGYVTSGGEYRFVID